jgi:hypothetical protein
MAPKSKRGLELKKNKPLNATKSIFDHPKISLNFALAPLKFQDDL